MTPRLVLHSAECEMYRTPRSMYVTAQDKLTIKTEQLTTIQQDGGYHGLHLIGTHSASDLSWKSMQRQTRGIFNAAVSKYGCHRAAL